MKISEYYHFLNPCWWYMHGSYDLRFDQLLTMLINDASNVTKISQNSYNILLEYRNKYYEVWIANYPYAACTTIVVYQPPADKQLVSLFNPQRPWAAGDTVLKMKNKRPSRKTVFDFIKTFCTDIDLANLKQDLKDSEVVDALIHDIPIVVKYDEK